MRAQKMDNNDSGVYSEWPAQQRMEITEETIWSIEGNEKISSIRRTRTVGRSGQG